MYAYFARARDAAIAQYNQASRINEVCYALRTPVAEEIEDYRSLTTDPYLLRSTDQCTIDEIEAARDILARCARVRFQPNQPGNLRHVLHGSYYEAG